MVFYPTKKLYHLGLKKGLGGAGGPPPEGGLPFPFNKRPDLKKHPDFYIAAIVLWGVIPIICMFLEADQKGWEERQKLLLEKEKVLSQKLNAETQTKHMSERVETSKDIAQSLTEIRGIADFTKSIINGIASVPEILSGYLPIWIICGVILTPFFRIYPIFKMRKKAAGDSGYSLADFYYGSNNNNNNNNNNSNNDDNEFEEKPEKSTKPNNPNLLVLCFVCL